MAGYTKFDVYPFILLNLAFSLQAAYAAPLILLAQTRQADRDKVHAIADAEHRDELHQISDQRAAAIAGQTEAPDRSCATKHQSDGNDQSFDRASGKSDGRTSQEASERRRLKRRLGDRAVRRDDARSSSFTMQLDVAAPFASRRRTQEKTLESGTQAARSDRRLRTGTRVDEDCNDVMALLCSAWSYQRHHDGGALTHPFARQAVRREGAASGQGIAQRTAGRVENLHPLGGVQPRGR